MAPRCFRGKCVYLGGDEAHLRVHGFFLVVSGLLFIPGEGAFSPATMSRHLAIWSVFSTSCSPRRHRGATRRDASSRQPCAPPRSGVTGPLIFVSLPRFPFARIMPREAKPGYAALPQLAAHRNLARQPLLLFPVTMKCGRVCLLLTEASSKESGVANGREARQ